MEDRIMLNSYYDIDLPNEQIIFIDSEESEVLKDYISKTVNYVLNESKFCQQYKLKRETNEVFTLIKQIFEKMDKEQFDKNCEIIASILLESEIDICKGAITPSSGGLVQALINKRENKGYYYVLIKNEFFSGVDRITMEKIEAFLHDEKKKSPLKICIFDIEYIDETESEIEINKIYVDDSIQRNHSVYWYDSFLGLIKSNTNEVNTNNAVDKMTSFWVKNIPDQHKALQIRNDTISYFRSNDYFDYNEYTDLIRDRHEIEDYENILEKLEKLSENQRQGFDKRFEISQPDIKKRLVTEKFKPSKTVTISIEGEIDFNTIYADKENGIDILKIRTDDPETIKAFTRKMEAESEV